MTSPLSIVFAGTPEFAVPTLSALVASPHEILAVYTQPDRPAGRGRRVQASPVKAVALEHGLVVRQPPSLKAEPAQAALRQLSPDLMVVVAYGLILPAAVLAVPRLGCVNVHASLLPRWRGAAPIQRAILAGDEETGVTIMRMDEGLDTGGILLQIPCPIGPAENAGSLHDRLARLGAQALMRSLPGIESGSLRPKAQNDTLTCYAAKLEKGESGLDWAWSAERLARKVRAFNPWPVAQAAFGSESLRVWEATALPGATGGREPPGTVLSAGAQGIDVATGGGILRLTRVQLPGRRVLTARDFVNAYSLDGVAFG